MPARPVAHLTPAELALLRGMRPLKMDDEWGATDHDIMRLAELVGRQSTTALTPMACVAGQIICREGDAGDALYLIRTGKAAVVKGEFSMPLVLAHRGAGDIIGEMALLENMPRSASAIALEPMDLIRLGLQDFQTLMHNSPAADVDMLRKLSRRLRCTDSILTTLSGSENRLNTRVTELTSENRQLQELQRLRQQTMDLVIHDLRNPLQGITAAADLLEMTLTADDRARVRRFFTYINANCQRLQHLVDSLIDISRMETGELQLHLQRTDPAEIVRSALKHAEPSFEAHGMTVTVDLAASMPHLDVDRVLIERVIINLLDNATKFTPGGGRIEVAGWKDCDELTISITDAGIGIPPEQREHLFERFARGTNPRTPRVGGFGLGLTFCRLAVEAHGGRIWIEDTPDGTGCRFVIALPVKRPESPNATDTGQSAV